MSTLIALLHGSDQPGLVARVSGWVFEHGGNILHADQHRDTEAGIFFQRVEWEPKGGATEAEAEARQLALIRELRADLVILARYMQVLSADFLEQFARPVINIHHSFLPAFAGGRPYHQAHERGVKLIGATAHYATRDLDEGPIIHQDVARVTHRDGVEEMIRKGRDLEKSVLAQAMRWHLDGRVLVYGNKTVIFD